MNFTDRTPQMIAMLKRFVETESPSHDKAAVDRMGKLVADECRKLNAEIEIIPQTVTGDHVIARWGKGSGGILTLCHMDTVFPLGTINQTPFVDRGETIHGPGILDMKSGIVITLTAIAALLESGSMPKRPITALFTSDEEIGSDTSREWIEKFAKESSLVLVLEAGTPNGAVKVWRKGVGDYAIKVKGRAAHAGGAHKEGRNAIEEIAHQVIAIQRMTDYEKGTTLNVGVIKGGTVSNVVPEEASIDIDFRVLIPAEADRVDRAMRALKPVIDGTAITVTGGLNRPPMPFDETMKATFEKAKRIAATIGVDLLSDGTGGGSDANFVAPLGVPVLDGLGAIGVGYHSDREYIEKISLADRVQLVAAILQNW
jgi:glutamate carboxypeptidase